VPLGLLAVAIVGYIIFRIRRMQKTETPENQKHEQSPLYGSSGLYSDEDAHGRLELKATPVEIDSGAGNFTRHELG
jgi:hypothetical protein